MMSHTPARTHTLTLHTVSPPNSSPGAIPEHTLMASTEDRSGREGRYGGASCRRDSPADPTTTLRLYRYSEEMNVQPTSDRDTAIDGRRHLSASKGLQGRTSTGVTSPVVVVHAPAYSTGSESHPRRPEDSRLASTDPSFTEVVGVPDQPRPVIAGGAAEGTGARCQQQPVAFGTAAASSTVFTRICMPTTRRYRALVVLGLPTSFSPH